MHGIDDRDIARRFTKTHIQKRVNNNKSMQKEILEHGLNINRRRFLSRLSLGIGSAALGSLLIPDLFSGGSEEETLHDGSSPFCTEEQNELFICFRMAHPRNWTCLIISPCCNEMFGEDLPASIRMGQRLTGMTADQKKFPLAGSYFKFDQYGQACAWISELLPHTSQR